MSKHIQLSITDPCHENWDNMIPAEKGRFCGSCQKQVIDFSSKSDREIAQFFKKPSSGSICGRFMQDQLDRSIEIPKKRIPWVKYFFQFALPAFLLSMKAATQNKVKIETISNSSVVPERITTIKKQRIANIQDTITLPEVIIVSQTPQIMGKLTTVGVTQVTTDTAVQDQSKGQTVILAGGVSVCRYPDFKWPKDSVVKQMFKKLLPENFKIYPNPVKVGASIHIEWKQRLADDFVVQVLNISGQTIFTKQMQTGYNNHLFEFSFPSVASGNYFLRMINKKSGKSYTEKIIVQ